MFGNIFYVTFFRNCFFGNHEAYSKKKKKKRKLILVGNKFSFFCWLMEMFEGTDTMGVINKNMFGCKFITKLAQWTRNSTQNNHFNDILCFEEENKIEAFLILLLDFKLYWRRQKQKRKRKNDLRNWTARRVALIEW